MNKKFLLAISIIMLGGCQLNHSTSDSSNFTISESFKTSSIDQSQDTNSTEYSLSSEEIINNSTASFIINPLKEELKSDEKNIFLNYKNYRQIGSYSTGNYSNQYNYADINQINGFEFEHYRALQNSIAMCTLLPFYENQNDGTYAGAFYNTTKIPSIEKIYMHYEFESLINSSFILNYGENNYDMQTLNISSNQLTSYIEISFTNTNFFKIETASQALKIIDFEIYYKDIQVHGDTQYLSSGLNEVRLNPKTFSGELIDGVSSVDVPVSVKINSDGSYVIDEVKKYTYYSYDYIVAHPSLAEKATIIDPIDVANYYIIFKKYPANYFSSASKAIKDSQSYNLFKDSIRQVSKVYTRTDGYVNALPYNHLQNEYIEFDIDIGNTYIIDKRVNRGVGRVVIFKNGFISEGYDSSPVAVFSDDHYSTFQEYLNIGQYSKRFNAQSHRTQYQWGSPRILN